SVYTQTSRQELLKPKPTYGQVSLCPFGPSLAFAHPNSNPYEHPMTLSVTPVCVLCTLVVGGRDYCVYLMTIWREAWFVKVLGSNAISSAEAGAPNEESENARRERG